ncbi:uncharacterized protein BDW70DRAFT_52522 [Aspergillus foveolatus]|uniref:uncharacterized protein n=1 Tax=Aspergillus foveolatus TaxID=210207 RepID=UPI003CCD3BED
MRKAMKDLEVAVNPLSCSVPCALLSCMHQRMCPNPTAAVQPIQPRPDPTRPFAQTANVEREWKQTSRDTSTAPSRHRDIRQVVEVRTGQAGKPCLPCFPAAPAAAIANGYQTCTRIRSAVSPIPQSQGSLLTDVQPRAGTDFRVPYHGQSLSVAVRPRR